VARCVVGFAGNCGFLVYVVDLCVFVVFYVFVLFGVFGVGIIQDFVALGVFYCL